MYSGCVCVCVYPFRFFWSFSSSSLFLYALQRELGRVLTPALAGQSPFFFLVVKPIRNEARRVAVAQQRGQRAEIDRSEREIQRLMGRLAVPSPLPPLPLLSWISHAHNIRLNAPHNNPFGHIPRLMRFPSKRSRSGINNIIVLISGRRETFGIKGQEIYWNRQIWMYRSDNRWKKEKVCGYIYFYDAGTVVAAAVFFSFFTNRQMCSAKGNGLSDCRNRHSKKKKQEKRRKKRDPASIKEIWRTLSPTDRSDKETKRNKMFFFSFFFLAVCLCDGHHDTLAINPSTLPLIRIRILEGAATAICGPSNKTHTCIKVSFIRFYPQRISFGWGGFFRESLGTIVSLYCPTGNLEERYGKYKT